MKMKILKTTEFRDKEYLSGKTYDLSRKEYQALLGKGAFDEKKVKKLITKK